MTLLWYSVVCWCLYTSVQGTSEILFNVRQDLNGFFECDEKNPLSIPAGDQFYVRIVYEREIYRPRCYNYDHLEDTRAYVDRFHRGMEKDFYISVGEYFISSTPVLLKYTCEFNTKPCDESVMYERSTCYVLGSKNSRNPYDINSQTFCNVIVNVTPAEQNTPDTPSSTERYTTHDNGAHKSTTGEQTTSSLKEPDDKQPALKDGAEIPAQRRPDGLKRGLLAGGVLMIVVAIIIIFTIAFISKRRQRISSSESNDTNCYQNLPQHKEGPMQMPPQWNPDNDPTYATPENFEHLYSKPIPKIQRQHLKQYANNDVTYANSTAKSQYQPDRNVEVNYASPIPKSQRCQRQNTCEQEHSTSTASINYIRPDNQTIYTDPETFFSKTNDFGTECMLDENYSSVQELGHKYANVFRNDRYENANRTEYAEPAYCEIAKNKTVNK